MRFALLLLIAIILIVPFSYGLTASIGNARMVLRTEVGEGEATVIEKSIMVNNVNEIPVKVNLEPDKNYKKIIEIFDNEFILQPGESKQAKFKITLRSGGGYEGSIAVGFAPADPDVKENGVGLSSTIIILADGPVNEHYYEVMESDETEEEPEEEVVPIEKNEINEFNNTGESGEGVSVSMGYPAGNKNEKAPEIKEQVSPLVGILIVMGVILIGLGAFFIIRKVSK